jgi:hypothetical protein
LGSASSTFACLFGQSFPANFIAAVPEMGMNHKKCEKNLLEIYLVFMAKESACAIKTIDKTHRQPV